MTAILRCLAVTAVLVLAVRGGAFAETARPLEPSAEHRTDEVTLRLVAEDARDGGSVRAALLVDLAPGWKTYWIDPGEAGIAPVIDLSGSANIARARTAFPVPHRFGDAYATSNGYSQPVAFALDLQQAVPGEPTTIRARVLLGVCREVCIPVSAELVREDGPSDPGEARLAEMAFALLPDSSTAEHGILAATLAAGGNVLRVEAVVAKAGPERKADLFVAGPKGWFFGPPQRETRTGSTIVFEVPVLARPKSAAKSVPLVVEAVVTVGAAAYAVSGLGVEGGR